MADIAKLLTVTCAGQPVITRHQVEGWLESAKIQIVGEDKIDALVTGLNVMRATERRNDREIPNDVKQVRGAIDMLGKYLPTIVERERQGDNLELLKRYEELQRSTGEMSLWVEKPKRAKTAHYDDTVWLYLLLREIGSTRSSKVLKLSAGAQPGPATEFIKTALAAVNGRQSPQNIVKALSVGHPDKRDDPGWVAKL